AGAPVAATQTALAAGLEDQIQLAERAVPVAAARAELGEGRAGFVQKLGVQGKTPRRGPVARDQRDARELRGAGVHGDLLVEYAAGAVAVDLDVKGVRPRERLRLRADGNDDLRRGVR